LALNEGREKGQVVVSAKDVQPRDAHEEVSGRSLGEAERKVKSGEALIDPADVGEERSQDGRQLGRS